MSDYYTEYRIHSAKITCRFTAVAGNNIPVYCGIFIPKGPNLQLPGAATPVDVRTYAQNKGQKMCLLTPGVGSNSQKSLQGFINIKKWYADSQFTTSKDYAAATTANPINLAIANVWVANADNNPLTNAIVFIDVTITVMGHFFGNRIQTGQIRVGETIDMPEGPFEAIPPTGL